MRLTTKGRFAVTAMIDLALNAQNNAVKLNSISERQQISLSYLEQLFSKLRRAGLVESIRGPGGGDDLGNVDFTRVSPQNVAAAEDELDATLCKGKANCQSGAPCLTHNLWENLNHTINAYLSSVTLAGLLAQQQPDKNTQIVKITHIY